MTRRTVVVLLAGALVACGAQKQEKRYPMQGEIKALDAKAKSATIQHGKIGDWMEAMTMDYQIKPDSEFAKLHVGDRIEATVVVMDLKYHVTDVKVVGGGAKP